MEGGVTHILWVWNKEGDDYKSYSFLTKNGAINAGIRHLERMWKRKFYGYLSANRFEGSTHPRRHIVAEWKDGGRVLAVVWT